ncbi:MAG: thioredoxin domain-containing protein [Gemmatimonadota bacterium]
MNFRPDHRLVAAAVLLAAAGCRGEANSGADAGPQAPPAAGLPVEGLGYATGLESAPVTVIEFSDFGCPYCAAFALDSYPDLHGEFVLSGQVRWIYIPFVIGRFPNGDTAAIAAECAGRQDRFWPMHDMVYARQSDWRRQGPADELFLEMADSIGLDLAEFGTCYRENHPAERIARHNELARLAGVRGTPTFVINGRPVEGALPPDHFRTLLEWAVAAAE